MTASSSAVSVKPTERAEDSGPALEPRTPRKWLITIAVMVGAMMEVLDTSIVNVSLPHMQGSFSASVDEITWVLTSYLVANAIMIPATGWISSRLGRKRHFVASVVVFVIASGLCGAARTLPQMVVFRLIQGGAGAAMIPSSQSILMETFPPSEHGLAMSMWGIGMLIAPMLGPTLGGWITENWTWRWNFYINLPVGTLAAILVYLFVHDPDYMRKARTAVRRIDYLAFVYLILGFGALQIVLDRGQRADWFAAPWVWAFTAIAAVALIMLVVHETRFPEPILDLRILSIAQFDLSVMIVMAMMVVIYGLNILNPLFFQTLMGYTPWKSGLAVAPRGIGTMAGMLCVAQFSRRGIDTRIFVGMGFAILGYALLAMSDWNLSISLSVVVFPMILSGLGSGLIFPILSASALTWVERERMVYAASLYNMMRNTGSAIGISIVTNLLNSRLQVHQAYLGAHFTVFEAWRLDNAAPSRMSGAPSFNLIHGLRVNHLQGFAVAYHTIQQQASLLAYNDVYRILAVMAVIFMPAFIFLKPRKRGAGEIATH
jgi:DHA2 family multidrug resistance protein